jgi:hypothetical protein
MPKLTIQSLCKEAATFSASQSKTPEKSLFGVTDGKAVGTYLKHKFRNYLKSRYQFEERSLDSDIAFPRLLVDVKTTCITKPESFCPFKSARQKVYGLGYSLLVFFYDKIENDTKKTATLKILNAILIEAERTADYQLTFGLRKILEAGGNRDEVFDYLLNLNLPIEEIGLNNLTDEILSNPPLQGFLTISTALQWRLNYNRAIQRAGSEQGVVALHQANKLRFTHEEASEETMKDYKADLLQRYWKYKKSQFPNNERLFDSRYRQPKSPPVFIRSEAWRNIIVNPSANEQEKKKLLDLIPRGEWHKWYGSMNSSQALAQSVLGNLAIYNKLSCLSELTDDEGLELFGKATISSNNFKMEHKIDFLGEPRQTSLDGYISGDYRIAIECKFTEAEVGTCSRPRMKRTASNFESEHCNGTYSVQRARSKRCSLTQIGVLYWKYVPQLFKWKSDSDLDPCPLNKNYQLVRNILAVGVKPNGTVSLNDGHVVLIYDERNPAFQEKGKGFKAYKETRTALIEPTMLRKCSWQRLVQHIRNKNILPWLTEHLSQKYGL